MGIPHQARSRARRSAGEVGRHRLVKSGEEGVHVPFACLQVVVAEQQDVAASIFCDDAGCAIRDEGLKARIHLIAVEQGEGDAPFGNCGIPGSLPRDTGMGDVAQGAVLTLEQVTREIAQFAEQAAIGAINADQSLRGMHPEMVSRSNPSRSLACGCRRAVRPRRSPSACTRSTAVVAC